MFRHGRYILIDGDPIECEDLLAWAWWLETADRQIAFDQIGDAQVSTVFLGLDHGFRMGTHPPVLWETMIFGGPHNGWIMRYASVDDARVGHQTAVALVREEVRS